jgi:catechol 2,3-dioxygenase-like lactoylglutathione lyase family enzyme
MEINGIAHLFLTVSDFAACRPFYVRLLSFLGLTQVIDAEQMIYFVGGRTAVGVVPAEDQYRDVRFAQYRSGLHHACFRSRTREGVDEVHRFLVEHGATIVHAPEEGPWAPGYYSVLFEDPDGIRLEVNFVPGKGLLAEAPGA